MIKKLILLCFALIATFNFTLNRQSSPISKLNLTENQTNLQAVNWPFVEGPNAPYPFKPTNVSFESIPAKGVDNRLTVQGRWRQQFQQSKQHWKVYCNNSLIDYLQTRNVIDHRQGSDSLFSWDIDLPQNYPSGMYTLNLFTTGYATNTHAYYINVTFTL